MTFRQTLYMPMHMQELPVKQSSLFAPYDIEEIEEPPCDHAITEPQASLFGGTDQVCVSCGATIK